ncbi:MAG: class I SAM-dependent methyltransferase [Candidatus Schekmanbacteria bacterium]|nr:class I SAM-dependent methyltransferase [Candidatus Schekmanbacteria bacterium]
MSSERLEKIWEPWFEKGDYRADFTRHLENRSRFYRLISGYLTQTAKVLEVGCGTAIDSNLLSAAFKSADFYATDISAKSVRLGRRISAQAGNRIFFIQGDINRLYFKDKIFDVIFSQGVLEHFPEAVSVVKEQVRVLQDAGVLIISVPQRYTAYTLMKKIKMYRKIWDWEWETEYSRNKLKRLGQDCGLREIECIGYQYWRSWWEPAWVLSDFYDKFYRRLPWQGNVVSRSIKKHYDTWRQLLEQRYGMYFMQNLVIAFAKEKTTN